MNRDEFHERIYDTLRDSGVVSMFSIDVDTVLLVDALWPVLAQVWAEGASEALARAQQSLPHTVGEFDNPYRDAS